MDLPLSLYKLDASTVKPSPFWYWRDPPSASSLDATVSSNIHQRLDGVPARSCDGVNPVSRTASLTLQYFLPVSKLTPPSWRAPNPSRNMRSHLPMRRSRMCSANRQPHNYPLTGHETVLGLGPHSPRVDCTFCSSRSARQWRTTSRRLSNKDSSALPPCRMPQAASSWARKTEACGPVSITGSSMITPSNSRIHFLWSRPPSRNSVGLKSFCGNLQSWPSIT